MSIQVSIAEMQVFRDDIIRVKKFIDRRPNPPKEVKEGIKRMLDFAEKMFGMDVTIEYGG